MQLDLSQVCGHHLFLTATPHRGRGDTFQKLLRLLDEDTFATEELASQKVHNTFFGWKNGKKSFNFLQKAPKNGIFCRSFMTQWLMHHKKSYGIG